MTGARAVLLDVFGTILTTDFDAAFDELAPTVGLLREQVIAGFDEHRQDLMTGTITPDAMFAAIARRACKPTMNTSWMVRKDVESLRNHTVLYPDVFPFLKEAKRRGIRVALVSNCAPNTRPLLEGLGLTRWVDATVLSCEVGTCKPDQGIYRRSLRQVAARPVEALFIDDQAAYCQGAKAIGISTIRIDRDGGSEGSVATLDDVLALLPT